ncbi:hypothetical protein QA597_10930 [Marinilabiliaceae bacterium ANBcel2]|nr:hypothetical protein [Marinilabiliaceae bacterium ANBcel2]
MKQLILTVNYELFFGDDSGTVNNCMIRPINHLCDVLDEFKYKMTVFWDILHYYRLKELSGSLPELRIDAEMIEKQIMWLIQKGHDVQMLIHPHWLDARWSNNKWKFSYNRFALHRLWDNDDPDDINSIVGCITISKRLMEQVCRRQDPSYKVRVFRAGGYRIEPFNQLSYALLKNEIYADSSAAHGIKSSYDPLPFNFTRLPLYKYYRFDDSVLYHDYEGKFWEFPKGTVSIPVYMHILFSLFNLFYRHRGRYGDGKKLGFMSKEKSFFVSSFEGSNFVRLTPEEVTPLIWNYFLKRAKDYDIAALSSKNLSPFTINMLKTSFIKRKLRFSSLIELIKRCEVYLDLKY